MAGHYREGTGRIADFVFGTVTVLIDGRRQMNVTAADEGRGLVQ